MQYSQDKPERQSTILQNTEGVNADLHLLQQETLCL